MPPDHYLSWREVKPLFGGISRTTAWRGVRGGWLPAPVQVSPGRRAWRASDVAAWQAALRPRSESSEGAAPAPIGRARQVGPPLPPVRASNG